MGLSIWVKRARKIVEIRHSGGASFSAGSHVLMERHTCLSCGIVNNIDLETISIEASGAFLSKCQGCGARLASRLRTEMKLFCLSCGVSFDSGWVLLRCKVIVFSDLCVLRKLITHIPPRPCPECNSEHSSRIDYEVTCDNCQVSLLCNKKNVIFTFTPPPHTYVSMSLSPWINRREYNSWRKAW